MGLPTAGDPAKLQAEVRAAAFAQNEVGTERQAPQCHKPKGAVHMCSRCPLKHLFHLQALARPAPYLKASVLRHRDDDVSLPRAKLGCSHGTLVPLQLSECRLTLGVCEGRSVSVCSGH